MNWADILKIVAEFHLVSWAFGFFGAIALVIITKFLRHKRRISRGSFRSGLFQHIEHSRGTRVIAIINREDRRLLPVRAGREYIELDTAEEMLSAMRKLKPNQPIDIILHTQGGEVTAALQIARALKAHPGRKTAFIPYYAFSAGTLIALTADEIVMGPHAVLGPIDPQIRGLPAASLTRLRAEKSVDKIGDLYFVLTEHAAKSLDEAKAHACDLVNDAHKPQGTCALTDDLVSGERTHGYPISVSEAKARGINVSTAVPDAVYRLVDSYRDQADEPALRHRDEP